MTELGKGTGEDAEQYRALAENLEKFRASDFSDILDTLKEEGIQAYNTSNYSPALEKWQTGLNQARALNNKQYISRFLTNIGEVYLNLGQYQRALEYYEQALAIRREIGDRRGEGMDLGNIGVVYLNLGRV